MKKILLFCCALFLARLAAAQETFPVNGAWDIRPGQFAFTNATIVVSADQTIPNGILLVKDRRIEAVGPDVKIPKGYYQFQTLPPHFYRVRRPNGGLLRIFTELA